MMQFKRTFFSSIVMASIILLFVAIFNAVIDPLGYFQFVKIQGLNIAKSEFEAGGGRRSKAMALYRGGYDVVIVGTSRSRNAIDPDSQFFSGKNVFNAALSGTNMYEIENVLDFILKYDKPTSIILEASFLMFSSRRTTSGDFEKSLFANNASYSLGLMEYLLSFDTIKHSINTVAYNRKNTISPYRSGFFMDNSPVDYRNHFNLILKQNFLVNPQTYAAFCYDCERVTRLLRALEQCRKRGVTVSVYIPPVHARQLEALSALGLWSTYNRWLKDVTNAVAKADSGEEKIRLYNFSGYNAWTTEDIPERPEDRMRWYRESSHFTPALGTEVLEVMLTDRRESGTFGYRLTNDSLPSFFTLLQQEKEGYALSHSAEIQEVLLDVKETQGARQSFSLCPGKAGSIAAAAP